MASTPSYSRVALLTLIPLLLGAIPVVWGSQIALQSMFNAPFRWVDYETPALEQFNDFLSEFGTVEYVLVSWPGGTLEDARYEQVAEALRRAQEDRESNGQPKLVSNVLSGYSLFQTLTSPPADLSRRAALTRMYGSLVGEDGETTCLVVALSDAGSKLRRESIEHVLEVVEQELGLERDDLKLAGPPVDGLAIDDESVASMQTYSGPAIALSFVLCCLFLRSLWLTLPIMLIGSLGQAASLAAVYYLGITMNAVLIVLPPLVFVLAVSAGVHLVNYYYEEIDTSDHIDGAISRSLAKARGPCFMAAITTAIGLMSLTISDVEPVRIFGAVAAAGVIVSVALLFLIVPGAMQKRAMRERATHKRAWFGWLRPLSLSLPSPRGGFAPRAGAIIWRSALFVTVVGLLLLVIGSVGLYWIRSSISVVSLLDEDNQAMQDFRWFEENIGPLIPVEVVIRFDESSDLDALQRLELIRVIQRQLRETPASGGWMSVASFLPDP
ncbi:MAG: MMPL family transporter, partial [Planctomycetota bacterium]